MQGASGVADANKKGDGAVVVRRVQPENRSSFTPLSRKVSLQEKPKKDRAAAEAALKAPETRRPSVTALTQEFAQLATQDAAARDLLSMAVQASGGTRARRASSFSEDIPEDIPTAVAPEEVDNSQLDEAHGTATASSVAASDTKDNRGTKKREIGPRDFVPGPVSSTSTADAENHMDTAGAATASSPLKNSELKKLAKTLGAFEDDLAEVDDSDDIRQAAIDLVIRLRTESERASFAKMKNSELKRLARSLGATENDIEEADDSDDMRAAVIALLLRLKKVEDGL